MSAGLEGIMQLYVYAFILLFVWLNVARMLTKFFGNCLYHITDCAGLIYNMQYPCPRRSSKCCLFMEFPKRNFECMFYLAYYLTRYCWPPVPVAARSEAWVCGRSPAEIVGSNPAGAMDICCECCFFSRRGFCHEMIIRPEESYHCRASLCVTYKLKKWGSHSLR
jgi:hypothetical protein